VNEGENEKEGKSCTVCGKMSFLWVKGLPAWEIAVKREGTSKRRAFGPCGGERKLGGKHCTGKGVFGRSGARGCTTWRGEKKTLDKGAGGRKCGRLQKAGAGRLQAFKRARRGG